MVFDLIEPLPIAPADPLISPNPVISDPGPVVPISPIDAVPPSTDIPFNPPTDSGNQNPVTNAATVAPPSPIPIAPPPAAPAEPVISPYPITSDPGPISNSLVVDAGSPPADIPSTPTPDSGNQNVQASVVNDPVMNAATQEPTNPTDIFNNNAQNQGGQEVTAPPDNNPAPAANQSGDAPILSATSAVESQGTPPASNDSGNSNDLIQLSQQVGQDLYATSGQAAQNVTDPVAQTNENIQPTLKPEQPVVANSEFPTQPSNNGDISNANGLTQAGTPIDAGTSPTDNTTTVIDNSTPNTVAADANSSTLTTDVQNLDTVALNPNPTDGTPLPDAPPDSGTLIAQGDNQGNSPLNLVSDANGNDLTDPASQQLVDLNVNQTEAPILQDGNGQSLDVTTTIADSNSTLSTDSSTFSVQASEASLQGNADGSPIVADSSNVQPSNDLLGLASDSTSAEQKQSTEPSSQDTPIQGLDNTTAGSSDSVTPLKIDTPVEIGATPSQDSGNKALDQFAQSAASGLSQALLTGQAPEVLGGSVLGNALASSPENFALGVPPQSEDVLSNLPSELNGPFQNLKGDGISTLDPISSLPSTGTLPGIPSNALASAGDTIQLNTSAVQNFGTVDPTLTDKLVNGDFTLTGDTIPGATIPTSAEPSFTPTPLATTISAGLAAAPFFDGLINGKPSEAGGLSLISAGLVAAGGPFALAAPLVGLVSGIGASYPGDEFHKAIVNTENTGNRYREAYDLLGQNDITNQLRDQATRPPNADNNGRSDQSNLDNYSRNANGNAQAFYQAASGIEQQTGFLEQFDPRPNVSPQDKLETYIDFGGNKDLANQFGYDRNTARAFSYNADAAKRFNNDPAAAAAAAQKYGQYSSLNSFVNSDSGFSEPPTPQEAAQLYLSLVSQGGVGGGTEIATQLNQLYSNSNFLNLPITDRSAAYQNTIATATQNVTADITALQSVKPDYAPKPPLRVIPGYNDPVTTLRDRPNDVAPANLRKPLNYSPVPPQSATPNPAAQSPAVSNVAPGTPLVSDPNVGPTAAPGEDPTLQAQVNNDNPVDSFPQTNLADAPSSNPDTQIAQADTPSSPLTVVSDANPAGLIDSNPATPPQQFNLEVNAQTVDPTVQPASTATTDGNIALPTDNSTFTNTLDANSAAQGTPVALDNQTPSPDAANANTAPLDVSNAGSGTLASGANAVPIDVPGDTLTLQTQVSNNPLDSSTQDNATNFGNSSNAGTLDNQPTDTGTSATDNSSFFQTKVADIQGNPDEALMAAFKSVPFAPSDFANQDLFAQGNTNPSDSAASNDSAQLASPATTVSDISNVAANDTASPDGNLTLTAQNTNTDPTAIQGDVQTLQTQVNNNNPVDPGTLTASPNTANEGSNVASPAQDNAVNSGTPQDPGTLIAQANTLSNSAFNPVSDASPPGIIDSNPATLAQQFDLKIDTTEGPIVQGSDGQPIDPTTANTANTDNNITLPADGNLPLANAPDSNNLDVTQATLEPNLTAQNPPSTTDNGSPVSNIDPNTATTDSNITLPTGDSTFADNSNAVTPIPSGDGTAVVQNPNQPTQADTNGQGPATDNPTQNAGDGNVVQNPTQTDPGTQQPGTLQGQVDTNQGVNPFSNFTDAAQNALDYYANLTVQGQNEGGAAGLAKQTLGTIGGLLSSLATQDNLGQTAAILALPVALEAGAGTQIGSALLSNPVVAGSLDTLGGIASANDLSQAISGVDAEGRQLSPAEQLAKAASGLGGGVLTAGSAAPKVAEILDNLAPKLEQLGSQGTAALDEASSKLNQLLNGDAQLATAGPDSNVLKAEVQKTEGNQGPLQSQSTDPNNQQGGANLPSNLNAEETSSSGSGGVLSNIPLNEIKYSQGDVSRTATGLDGNRVTIDQAAENIRANGFDPTGAPDVVKYPNGDLVTLDHRRLVAANRAGIEEVPAHVHLAEEPLPPQETRRFTLDKLSEPITDPRTGKVYQPGAFAKNYGEAALFRSANQRQFGFSDFPLQGSTEVPKVRGE